MGDCTEIAPMQFGRTYYDDTGPEADFNFETGGVKLGDAMIPDVGVLNFFDFMQSGSIDLGSATQSQTMTCTSCLGFLEDADVVTGTAGRTYFASKGTLNLTTNTFPAIAGSLSDVTLVEVTIDAMSGVSTPVAGGKCIHIATASFNFPAAPQAWIDAMCLPEDYADNALCNCEDCGVPDPDCSLSNLDVIGCDAGQTCTDGKTCMGAPTGWTCTANKYNAGDGCDCNCGVYDADCDRAPAETIVGCQAGEKCGNFLDPMDNLLSVCVPAAWTCDPNFFKDGLCDCGCGVHDSDCADNTVVSCDDCADGGGMQDNGTPYAGSCNTSQCPGTINATNNAVCM